MRESTGSGVSPQVLGISWLDTGCDCRQGEPWEKAGEKLRLRVESYPCCDGRAY